MFYVFCQKPNFNKFRVGERRSLNDTVCLLSRMHSSDKNNTELIVEILQKSILPIPPVHPKFPFVGIEPVSDMYNLFKIEPMHSFWIGISSLLKGCATTKLRDES